METIQPWCFRRANGSVFSRKKFACRSRRGQNGIVLKKPMLPVEGDNIVEVIILSSGDSSCFIVENGRKRGLSPNLEKEQSLIKKLRVQLGSAASCVLSEKIESDGKNVFGRFDEFELLDQISNGSYGVVYRARENKTGEIVAMKQELHGLCQSSLREIDILNSVICHPAFVEFREVVRDEFDGVYVVMEYVENDLRMAMKRMEVPFTVTQVKSLVKQLLEGVKFLHENKIMHRDLKPSNILLTEEGLLKICDFGLSRRFERAFDSYSPRVATLWYRAPELILGAEKYSSAVDMWSVGCIMGELLLKQVIFEGDSEIDQLRKIYEVLGTPNEVVWPGFSSFPGSVLVLEERPSIPLGRAFPMLPQVGVDLLSKLLIYNPEERITAEDALSHDWFREV